MEEAPENGKESSNLHMAMEQMNEHGGPCLLCF
jgi:hypothetical protein